MDAWFAEASAFTPPYMLVMSRFGDIDLYFDADRGEDGIALFEELSAQLQGPMAMFVPMGALNVAIELEDVDQAREAHARAVESMESLQLEMLRGPLVSGEAKIDELDGDFASAAEKYRTVAGTDPTQDFNTQIGRALVGAGQFDEAKTALEEALRLSPSSPRAHFQMARVLEQQGDVAAAIEHLDAALVAWENADEVFGPAREAREKLAELRPVAEGS